MCFMTPKRLRCGNASTIWVVVRGRCRRRSRIDRLVLSDKAFHTSSRSSPGTLAPLARGARGAILSDSVKDVLPAGADALAVRRINEADGAMTKIQMRSSGPLLELHFDMVHRRVRHEHRTAQFQQHGRLDHLHMSPQMADAIAAITEP